jgi:hypothetical protein
VSLDPGTYEILIAYTPNQNRASNAPISIKTNRPIYQRTLNQKQTPNQGSFHRIATLQLGGPTEVTLSNKETNGHVIADAVLFVKK